MTSVDQSSYNIWVAICKQHDPDGPIYWMILMGHPGADRCTRFPSTGYPGEYEVQIEADKRIDIWSLESKHFICRIPASYGEIVWDEAEAIPAQSCQCWVSYLLFRLEQRYLVPYGTYEHWVHFHMTSHREDWGPGCLYR
jgi:hypothetical protein